MNILEIKSHRRSITQDMHVYRARLDNSYPNSILHLLLSVITAGLWLPVWLSASLWASRQRNHAWKMMLECQVALDELDKKEYELEKGNG